MHSIMHLIAVVLWVVGVFVSPVLAGPFPKRGIIYNEDISVTDFGGGEVFWQYNWDSNTAFSQDYTEFIPQLWADTPEYTDSWNGNVAKWLNKGTPGYPTIHLIGFNECDDPAQSNMSPQEAADSFRQWLTPFTSQGAVLVGPSVTNGAGGMPWMQEFWPLCSDCQIEFANFHWYEDVSNFAGFQSYITAACDLVAPAKIWITEFEGTAATNAPAAQSAFMSQALPWLDDNPCVDRYAWFGSADPADRNLLVGTGPELTALGVQYVNEAFD